MPYCPKCDMEFVEGITVCSDCKGPLIESKEEAMRQKAEEQKKREEELLRLSEEEKAEDGSVLKKRTEPTQIYRNKKQRFEDMNSSASAFFLLAAVLGAALVLNLAGIFHLPLSGVTGYVFQGLLAVMAAGSLAVGFSSRKSALILKAEASDEQKETDEILSWFLKTYDGKDLDQQLLSEEPSLSEEELALRRFELIQDYLVTGRDLPDQSYVDALCDMIYSRLYDK